MSGHPPQKDPAPRNRSITLTDTELKSYQAKLLEPDTSDTPLPLEPLIDRTILADTLSILPRLPEHSIDLVFADPPYNLTKSFNQRTHTAQSLEDYERWLRIWLPDLARILRPSGSLYVCGDWRSSAALHRVLNDHFTVRSRITWEREKGRGSRRNWKNASEDIWFATCSGQYTFNVDQVKLKRRVRAPYRTDNGQPKDWQAEAQGKFRVTYPSNVWTDLTVPFWSMPENTEHPTQKPEKLLAKVLLASSNPGDLVFDPFLGSGTTSVVASKLDRHYIGIEIDPTYACLAEKRLAIAQTDRRIQGYTDGVFWERNSKRKKRRHD
ncbi:MAG: site-specific DNA-methyltransferase [Chloroflexi bacterium]|nr:site-specific DNA-methyltransferase [Chloroflexota bacterium]